MQRAGKNIAIRTPVLTGPTNMAWATLMGLLVLGLAMGGCKAPDLSLSRSGLAPVLDAPLRQAREAIPPSGRITVRENDSIYDLAARYGVSPLAIVRDNNIGPPYQVVAGQVLVIKPMRVHIVTSADSLFSISQRYAISRYQLAQMNGLNEPYELTVGQRLALPDTLDFSILDAAPDGSGTSPAVTNVAAAAATPAPAIPRKRFVAPTGTGDFRWPLAGEIITEFGPAARGVHNDGVNIAAEQGAAVMSAARGTVAFVGRDIKSFGTLVLVKHDGGIITAYAHLDQVMVKEGDVVEAGSQIATVGTSGKVVAPQLHFEIRKSRQPIDPRRLIA